MKTIVFDVTEPAPTQQQLDAMIAGRAKRTRLALGLWCIGTPAGVTACILSTPAFSPGSSLLAAAVNYAGLLGGIFVTADLIMLFNMDDYCGAEPLPVGACGEMLTLCNTSEQSRRYLADVLTQGREFVRAELPMMQIEAKRAEEEAHRKALYTVPD